MTRFFISIFIIVVITEHVNGQVLGPELSTGNAEIGYFHAWYHRDLDDKSPQEFNWDNTSIFVKYGISNYITFSLEAMITNSAGNKLPQRDYRNYSVGGGVALRLMRVKSNKISFGLHYKEWLGFDRSRSRYHKNHRGIIISVQIERKLALYNQQIIFWGGPAYVLDEIKQYPGFPYIPYTDESYNNLGFTAGFNFIIKKHFDPFIHIVYADYFQPRIGLGYQF